MKLNNQNLVLKKEQPNKLVIHFQNFLISWMFFFSPYSELNFRPSILRNKDVLVLERVNISRWITCILKDLLLESNTLNK